MVVDASVLAALLFGEAKRPAVVDRLVGARLTAPALLDVEPADICRTKIRRHTAQREALRLRGRLAIETISQASSAAGHGG